MLKRSTAAFAVAGLLAACSASPPATDGGTGGGGTGGGGAAGGAADAGMPVPDAYQEQVSHAAQAAVDVQQVVGLVDSFFQLDPTLDPSKTPEENALAIQARTQQKLAGCGTVTVNGTMVTVELNGSTGCTLGHMFHASGTISMNVSSTSGILMVATMFTGAIVNGAPTSASIQFSTSTGSDFTIIGTTTVSGVSLSLSLQVSAAGAGTTGGDVYLNGSIVESSGGTGTTYNLSACLWYLDQCYPTGGEIMIFGTGISMRYLPSTAFTGQFDAFINGIDYVGVMPPWAMCPR